MKTLKYFLICLLALPFFVSCNDDDVEAPNVNVKDFLTVTNRVATVSMDSSSGMYVLTEYEKDGMPDYETNVYLVDREEDAEKIAALNGVSDVLFSGSCMITDYRPSGVAANKKCYKILLTSVKAN